MIGNIGKEWSAQCDLGFNNREDGDLRRHRAYYDVIVMRGSYAGVKRAVSHPQQNAKAQTVGMILCKHCVINRPAIEFSIISEEQTFGRNSIVFIKYENFTPISSKEHN